MTQKNFSDELAPHLAKPAGASQPVAVADGLDSGKNRETENFPVGSFLIRGDLRPHIHAFYNFARAADDIADHPLLEPAQKIRRLDMFAAALLETPTQVLTEILPAGNPLIAAQALTPLRHTKIIADMRDSLRMTGVDPQHCLDLLTAFKRDATQLRYTDWADLMDYCRYSANPVGRHVLALHGIGKEAWPANDALCSALQIINHIQDCADDYRQLDRVYLPQSILAMTGAKTADLAKTASTPELRSALMAMLEMIAAMMPQARRLPQFVPDKRLKLETAIIGALADNLLKLLRRRDPLCDNVKLGTLGKLRAVIKGIRHLWL